MSFNKKDHPLTIESEIVDSQNHVPIYGFDFVICSFVDL
jgi:hypothetical protein